MKKIVTAIACFFSLLAAQSILAQDASEIAIRNMVDSQRFEFVAQVAIPMGGRSRNLDYGYDLKVKKDTVVAYLPFYGRSYSAGYGDSGGGIEFTSHDFKYEKEVAKKGGWTITISPKDTERSIPGIGIEYFRFGNHLCYRYQ